jgi:FAD/FMN-containing dehydrogenase
MSGMDKILKINGLRTPVTILQFLIQLQLEADGDLVCQAGARWEDINGTLAEKGIPLFFPASPSCICSPRLFSFLWSKLDPGPTAVSVYVELFDAHAHAILSVNRWNDRYRLQWNECRSIVS